MLPPVPRTPRFHLATLVVAATLLALPVDAQRVGGGWSSIHRLEGAQANDSLGVAVVFADDFDGDGYDELVVGASRATVAGMPRAGKVLVVSGFDGHTLYELAGTESFQDFGRAVASCGDLDGDSIGDFLIGAPGTTGTIGGPHPAAGAVFVHSGASGARIRTLEGEESFDTLGSAVAGMDDVDGDGFPDLLLGAVGANSSGNWSAGSAYLHSGATGLLLRQIEGQAAFEYLGRSVADAGDLDGDSVPDLLIGANGSNAGRGSALVISGATGALLHRFDGNETGERLGGAVAAVGDLDGDGIGDLVLGATGASPMGKQSAGKAYVLSGATGSVLFSFEGKADGDLFGCAVAGAGDLDEDGVPDLLIGACEAAPGGREKAGEVTAISGATGAVLHLFEGEAPLGQLGFAVAGDGRVRDAAVPEVALGAYGAQVGALVEAGTVRVEGFDPYLVASADALSVSSGIDLQLTVDFPTEEGGSAYALLVSGAGTGPVLLTGVEVPLSADSIFLRMLGGWSPPILVGTFGTLDAQGDAQATYLADPRLSANIGSTFYTAAISYDPSSSTASRSSVARSVTIEP